MTPPPPPDPIDHDAPLDADEEALLAVIDDDASPEQRRRVGRDPELRTRLAEIRTALAALAAPVPAPDEATLARLRTQAIDAGAVDAPDPTDLREDEEVDRDDEVRVVPLAPARPAGGRRSLPPWPAVAAVVILLMGIGLALITSDLSRSGQDDAASSGDAAQLSEEELAEGRDLGAEAAGGGADGDAPVTTVAPGEGSGRAEDEASPGANAVEDDDLASYADDDALRRELQAIDPATLQPPGAGTGGADPAAAEAEAAGDLCSQGLQSVDPAIGPALAARLVLVDGARRLVLSNPVAATAEEPSNTRLTVFDPNGCVPIFAVQR